MDQTYAEIENELEQIGELSPRMNTPEINIRPQQFRRSRHFKEHFDSRLPIEYRYPKRSSATSSLTKKKRSLASKSSSSGYSSSGSTSSIATVYNWSRPYRPKNVELDELELPSVKERQTSKETMEVASMLNIVVGEESGEKAEEIVENKKRACCIECREKEIREELDLESHQYANLQSLQKPQDPYVFLMSSMLANLQKEEGGRKVPKVQQKIEKVLRLKQRKPFNVDNKIIFDREISTFVYDVTIRLRAISEVSPETYRDVSAKFCEALHFESPNSKSLKSIVKSVKSLLTL